MSEPTCETCRFWMIERQATEECVAIGECHRLPPSMVYGLSKLLTETFCGVKGEIDQECIDNGDHKFGLWPKTFGYEWCGEHSPIPFVPQIVPGVSEHPTTNEA